ncbi:hypothetical protein CKAH01_03610 [Colletotrichum kahawae]|uniref:F-box domain-containing protein n=1 Tax=Colletotrichum kahawae TaxID=34407 RepID=A0AAD9YPR7_COLKA|nr:hypothetical protein CKAH01_03610 [Colletotrichum kahawae]
MAPARSPHESHCLSGFLQRYFWILYPEDSISLQENNTSKVDDARSDWATTDDEESDEKSDTGEVDDARSDWSTTEDEESNGGSVSLESFTLFSTKFDVSQDDGSANRNESDLVQVGYADRPCDTDDKATATSTPKVNGHTKSRNNLNDLGWPKNARIDPWMAAVWQNAAKSPLCGLPDHILLNIMRRLDLIAICQLRRASREFLRLFSSHEFEKWWYKGSDYEFLWASPVLAPGSVNALKFGAMSAFCAPCYANRNLSGWKQFNARCQLYCSGCKKHHTASLFSAAERNKAPVERICIGREGYIRLCEHKTFNWDDFVRASSEASKFPRDGSDLACCKHAPRQPGLPPVEYNAFVLDQWVYLEKAMHMSFPRTSPAFRLNADELRQRLAEEQVRDLCPWYQGPRHLDLMGCFDPNVCLCLHYEGRERFEPLLHPKAPQALNRLGDCPRRPGGHENHKWAKNVDSYLNSEFRRCSTHTNCLELELFRTFSAMDDEGRPLTPSSPEWYLALDPESHNLTEDDEFREVTWCEDQACRNYYKLREHASLGTMY